MGVLVDLSSHSWSVSLLYIILSLLVLPILTNILIQKLRLFQSPTDPPIVSHWIPFIGSTVTYGIDPYKFFFKCREKYGNVFTFILLGKKTTVCLGPAGNDFVLHAKLKDANAKDIYGELTTPVFGKGVVYDCEDSRFMEQKRFVKFGLSTNSLRSYVPMIAKEVQEYIDSSAIFAGKSKGVVDAPVMMGEVTIRTATSALQGSEIREKFGDPKFAALFHDLDLGFSPINFIAPNAPLPHNRKRDYAQQSITKAYLDIIKKRRERGPPEHPTDMLWNLMSSTYKDGTPLPDDEVAHLMMALLLAGQHSSAAVTSWIVLRLAQQPVMAEKLLAEQRDVLGSESVDLTYDNIQTLKLHNWIIKETLRLHAPIHSIMRRVTSPMAIENYVVPIGNVILAAPGASARDEAYFENPMAWDPYRWEEYEKAGKTFHQEENKEGDDEKPGFGYGFVSKSLLSGSPYLPFGAGRHRCIGERFAMVELTTILATLVRVLKFRGVNGSDKIRETDYSSMFSGPMRPAIVEWEYR